MGVIIVRNDRPNGEKIDMMYSVQTSIIFSKVFRKEIKTN